MENWLQITCYGDVATCHDSSLLFALFLVSFTSSYLHIVCCLLHCRCALLWIAIALPL